MAYAREAQWERSEKGFRRAIELDPHVWSAHVDFVVNLLVPLGRIEEALRELRIAEKIERLEPVVHFLSAWVLMGARRYDEAAAHCEKLPADYGMRINCLGRARIGQARLDDAIHLLAASSMPFDQASLGYAYARAGRRDEAEKLATLTPDAFFQAMIFAGLGDKERTLEALDRMVPLGPSRLGRVRLYGNDVFAAIPGSRLCVKKVGLPD